MIKVYQIKEFNPIDPGYYYLAVSEQQRYCFVWWEIMKNKWLFDFPLKIPTQTEYDTDSKVSFLKLKHQVESTIGLGPNPKIEHNYLLDFFENKQYLEETGITLSHFEKIISIYEKYLQKGLSEIEPTVVVTLLHQHLTSSSAFTRKAIRTFLNLKDSE